MNRVDIRQAVLDEMKRRNWDIVDLARRLEPDVSYRHIYGWLREKPDRSIALKRLEPILRALGLNVGPQRGGVDALVG